MTKHYTDVFERLPEDKQNRILDAAIREFAAKGFGAANINTIAKSAGVSIGALYKYFGSKDDVFLTVIDRAYDVLEEVIAQIDAAGGDIYAKLEMMVRAAQKYAKIYPELNQIYLDMTSEGLSHLSSQLSGKLESISSKLYRNMIRQAKDAGIVDAEIDTALAAFSLDNLILTLQFSYTSAYYKERMKVFLGPDLAEDEEAVVRGIMRFIRGALEPPTAKG